MENDPGMPGKSETVELLQGIVSEVEASGNGENKINELKRLRYGTPYRYMAGAIEFADGTERSR